MGECPVVAAATDSPAEAVMLPMVAEGTDTAERALAAELTPTTAVLDTAAPQATQGPLVLEHIGIADLAPGTAPAGTAILTGTPGTATTGTVGTATAGMVVAGVGAAMVGIGLGALAGAGDHPGGASAGAVGAGEAIRVGEGTAESAGMIPITRIQRTPIHTRRRPILRMSP